MAKTTQGFSLIELMIVLTIIGILATVAYPSYQDSVRKGRRSEAQQLLVSIADKEEMYLLDSRTYANAFTSLNFGASGWTCTATTCSNAFYSTSITVDNTATPPTYEIVATTLNDQEGDGYLTFNSAGEKTRRVGGVGEDLGW